MTRRTLISVVCFIWALGLKACFMPTEDPEEILSLPSNDLCHDIAFGPNPVK